MTAIAHASDRIRPHLHQGDLLAAEAGRDFDTVFGLDIFEHLNPNRLRAYLDRLKSCLVEGGLLFAVIPAFGCDPVFGQVFPHYLPGSHENAAAGQCFTTLHVDDRGYPINGHLTWADSQWWVEQFAQSGLIRRPHIEIVLHQKYDDYMKTEAPARRSFYVMSAGEVPDEQGLIRRIQASPSRVLSSGQLEVAP
jgi:hypothetical protein